MTVTAYLAGPDVFLPNAVERAARKVAICQRFGFRGLPPLNQDVETAASELKPWQAIFEKDVAMMERSHIIIANLTPFGGASADAGTLIEVGWFLGRGRPIFGYSNAPDNYETRMRGQLGDDYVELGIEGSHLPDNLMIVGAVHSGGTRSLCLPMTRRAASMRWMCSRPVRRRWGDLQWSEPGAGEAGPPWWA